MNQKHIAYPMQNRFSSITIFFGPGGTLNTY